MTNFAEVSDKGRRSRELRSDLRRRLHADQAHASEILREPLPWWLETLPVGKFMCWPCRIRQSAVDSMLRQASLSETRLLGELTDRQRGILADALDLRERARAAKTTTSRIERRDSAAA